MKRIFGQLLLLVILFSGCQNTEKKRFSRLNASKTGITFSNELTATPDLNILNYLYFFNGAGVAAADFNNDGLIDLYFTANQGDDQLYLNKGGWEFENITALAQIKNTGNWTTGVTHVDINNDGLLDLYVSKVGDYNNIKGKNLLFVNQGINADGIPIFKEDAASYGLDFVGFSTQAAFMDYDLDGDLDMFLLNHSVHPNNTYGKGSQRLQVDPKSGDRFFKNDDGYFTDVSEETGIFQGRTGYGLGLGVSDLNNDGYPDVYIGNDFFENDYLYINQKDGTFKDIISANTSNLGHTTHYSMGNDIADINNDGLYDIVSLDMLPEDLETYKTSGLEYPYPSYQYYLKNGYAPQYMQNTLHLNLGNQRFSEIAHLSGIAATEWSWGALLADFDNDSFKDIYITNGIKRATNDMDFISFIANESIQKRLEQGMSSEDMEFIKDIPQKKVPNYIFENNGNMSFSNVTSTWYTEEPSYSNGVVYADLDNDGDLDIVVNNIEEEALVLKNNTASGEDNHYLQIKLRGNPQNQFGIGAKLIAYTSSGTIFQENFVSRGYLSAVSNRLHMGVGKNRRIDSVQIIWPQGNTEIKRSIEADTLLIFNEIEATSSYLYPTSETRNSLLNNTENPILFTHKDPATLEFDREPLVPFANTNEGPEISVADINNDGLDDLFVSGAKGQPSQLFIQGSNGAFSTAQEDVFLEDAMNEDVSQHFFDANGDEWQDLLVVSGGNEFLNGPRLRPRLYINRSGTFEKDTLQFQKVDMNASGVTSLDVDTDGDLDILISSDQIPQKFGASSKQYVFLNDGMGNFDQSKEGAFKDLEALPNVKSIISADIDNDGQEDLIAAGYWMPISILHKEGGNFVLDKDSGLTESHGWWNTVVADDFDNDGDIDLIAGNWGNNSRLKASKEKPINLYRSDFDQNGSVEPLVTYYEGDIETPFASKDELVKQMPFLNKEFLSYKRFAGASMDELFSSQKLVSADRKQLYELSSIYMENDGKGSFIIRKLPLIAQASVIRDIIIDDLNNDGFKDVFVVGNTHEISTQLGRMDALHGLILLNDKKGQFYWAKDQNFDVQGAARSIQKINIATRDYYIIGINNAAPVFLIKNDE